MDNVRISRNNGANYRKLATAFVPKTLFEKARCGVARRGGRGEGHCSLFQANAGERSLTEGASVSIAMETMKGIYVSFLFQRGGGERVGTETVETDRENIGRESLLSG